MFPTTHTPVPGSRLSALRERLIDAVLYRAYAAHAHSGRDTAGASCTLDLAYEQVEKAFAAYDTAVQEAIPTSPVVPAPLLDCTPLGWEARTPADDPLRFSIVCPGPIAALEAYRSTYPVLREQHTERPGGQHDPDHPDHAADLARLEALDWLSSGDDSDPYDDPDDYEDDDYEDEPPF